MDMLNNSGKTAIPNMTLCTILTAVLAACGGGTTDASGAGDLMVAAVATSSAGTDADALRIKADPAAKTVKVASEGEGFSVRGSQRVRYGADSRWIQKIVNGTGQCSNDFFGTDPAVGTLKSCEVLLTVSAVSDPVAQPTPVSGPAPSPTPPLEPVRDSTAAPASAVVPQVTAWVRLAEENEAFTATANVRFGDGAKWVNKTTAGPGSCSVNFFGADPAYGGTKFCEVQMTVPGVVQTGTRPVVNTALIPKPATAYSTARIRTLTASELLQPVYQTVASEVGAFREPCHFSHMAADDPIVYPGQPGKSHLHTFFGNDKANAASTADNLMASGNSTCAGGHLNRTAYWMPTLIDIRTGQPLVPAGALFYYKLGYLGVKTGTVQTFPKGLRMIAGDSGNTLPIKSPNVGLECGSGGGHQPSMPNCAVGDKLNVSIIFPQCWDGINLDSPDHKSHMAYATGNGCPASHPVALPEIALNVAYKIGEANVTSFWRFSSDDYVGSGGHSLHADWFNGWEVAVNKTFVKDCLNSARDCHANLLGDGTILY